MFYCLFELFPLFERDRPKCLEDLCQSRRGQSTFEAHDVLSLASPEGGAKDAVKKNMPSSPCYNTRLGREKRDVERETIFIMEQRSLTGKHNYGQTVATA